MNIGRLQKRKKKSAVLIIAVAYILLAVTSFSSWSADLNNSVKVLKAMSGLHTSGLNNIEDIDADNKIGMAEAVSLLQSNVPVILEAENAVIGPDLSILEIEAFDTPCIGIFPRSYSYVDFSYTAERAGIYVIRFRTFRDKEDEYTVEYKVNSFSAKRLRFPEGPIEAKYTKEVGVYFNQGVNTIRFLCPSTDLYLDHLTIRGTPVHDNTTITPDLVNPNATAEARALYSYLKSNYGEKIISGYTGAGLRNVGYWDEVVALTGTLPKIYAADFNTLTPGYPFCWYNEYGTNTFGIDNQYKQVEKAIEKHNEGHIITIQWHWYAPSGSHGPDPFQGARGEVNQTNTLHPNFTNFDVRKAVDPSTVEYAWAIEDIDTIAESLKELQDAGVPVLWRPLHEAAGDWFWWGRGGTEKEAFSKLWDIMYDRFTNYHKLNNLVWVLSQAFPEKGWLVDHNKYDIIAFDNYPGAYNYDPQIDRIRLLREQGRNEKMVAITETGPLPDPELNHRYDAMYSYFVGWGQESFTRFNTEDQFRDVYTSDLVIRNE